MISPIAYSPPGPPLSRARSTVLLGFLLAPALLAMIYANPIVLAGCAVAVVILARGAGASAAARASARFGLLLGLTIAAVNGLVVRRGDTVLLRGPDPPGTGPIDVTAEALGDGAILAARILIVIAAFAIASARTDPDQLLRSLRRVAGRSALTAGLLVRMVPLAAADLVRLREAAQSRGPGATPVTRPLMLRRLVAGSLDRAVDSAAALEVRGYGSGARIITARERRPGDRLIGTTALAVAIAGVGARIAGLGGFDAYPQLSADTDAWTFAIAALPVAGAALPFVWGRGR